MRDVVLFVERSGEFMYAARLSTSKYSGMVWESQPETVIARYAKCGEGDRYPEYLRTRGIRRENGGTTLQA